jgi:glutamyl-tRNA synthetase
MPLRVLLTGKLHGPDMGYSVLLLHRADAQGVVAPEAGFVTLNERFNMLRQLDWEALINYQPLVESAATISN